MCHVALPVSLVPPVVYLLSRSLPVSTQPDHAPTSDRWHVGLPRAVLKQAQGIWTGDMIFTNGLRDTSEGEEEMGVAERMLGRGAVHPPPPPKKGWRTGRAPFGRPGVAGLYITLSVSAS
jgi:hypothetical protein